MKIASGGYKWNVECINRTCNLYLLITKLSGAVKLMVNDALCDIILVINDFNIFIFFVVTLFVENERIVFCAECLCYSYRKENSKWLNKNFVVGISDVRLKSLYVN